MELSYGGADEGENDVKIVDHEIQNDVHIEGAWTEEAEPVGLKEHRPGDVGAHCPDGRIEALQMTHLEDASVSGGEADEQVCVFEGRCERLLDEQVDPGG